MKFLMNKSTEQNRTSYSSVLLSFLCLTAVLVFGLAFAGCKATGDNDSGGDGDSASASEFNGSWVNSEDNILKFEITGNSFSIFLGDDEYDTVWLEVYRGTAVYNDGGAVLSVTEVFEFKYAQSWQSLDSYIEETVESEANKNPMTGEEKEELRHSIKEELTFHVTLSSDKQSIILNVEDEELTFAKQ